VLLHLGKDPLFDRETSRIFYSIREMSSSRAGFVVPDRCEALIDLHLAAAGITEIDPEGEPFDPERHEAMSLLPSATAEPNSVIAVVQKGYALHERIVRPARVVVAQAPPAPNPGTGT